MMIRPQNEARKFNSNPPIIPRGAPDPRPTCPDQGAGCSLVAELPGPRDFLGFIFEQSGGKVTFAGQFLDVAPVAATDTVLNRLDTYIRSVSMGNNLPDFYRQFAANLFFNQQSYQSSWDPWSKPINGLDKPVLTADQKSFAGTFTLPANYTASLLTLKIQAAPPTGKRLLRIRVTELANAFVEAYDMGPSPGMNGEPIAFTTFVAKGDQYERTFDDGDFLCLLANNASSSDGSATVVAARLAARCLANGAG